MIEVVAACIRRGQTFLICQRARHKSRGLLWEFAGGKVEVGETKQQALIRECQEELGIPLAVTKQCASVTYSYPDVCIHLTLWDAVIAGKEEPQKLEHEALCWIKPQQAKDFTFCPADTKLLQQLGYLPDKTSDLPAADQQEGQDDLS